MLAERRIVHGFDREDLYVRLYYNTVSSIGNRILRPDHHLRIYL